MNKVYDNLGEYQITEGISGSWHYHLSDKSGSICGAKVMYTAIPVEMWNTKFGKGFPTPATWCEKCNQLSTAGELK